MKNKWVLALLLLTVASIFWYSITSAWTVAVSNSTSWTTSTWTTVKKTATILVKTVLIDWKKYKIYKTGKIYSIVKPDWKKSPKAFTTLSSTVSYINVSFKSKVTLNSTWTSPKKVIVPVNVTSTWSLKTASTWNVNSTNTTTTTNNTNNYDTRTRVS